MSTGRTSRERDAAFYSKLECPIRFVITNLSKCGSMYVLTFPGQGRYTYETRDEAERILKLFEPGLRQKILGARADTLTVREVACWPVHHDPKQTVW